MRRRKIWAFMLALLLATGGSVRAADDDDDEDKPPAKSGWFSSWFGGKDKKPEAKKPAKKTAKAKSKAKEKEADEHKAEKPAEKPTLHDHLAQLRSRAQANYFRRLNVCLKLQQVAIDTKDDELLKKVKGLEKRVWEAYRRHLDINHDLDPFESDEDIFERHLGEAGRPEEADEQVLTRPVRGLTDPVAAEDKP